ncbi:WhiB family transcriptional regulator [Pseudonocardia sp.]|uniref:WhiB family transcriptional regulator n=1 Tax=Pseudonocardia sp. TaxID=60912 RepID=UPI003D152812
MSAAAGNRVSTDWRAAAVCAQVDPELFFAEADRGRAYEAQVAAAKAVCAVCPVRAECLSFARALPYGVAGGLAPEERRGLTRPDDAPVWPAELEPSGTRREIAAAGRAALRAGHDLEAVARMCRVTRRTALRWAAQVRDENGAAA